jgi:hypothetical protein
MLKYRLIWPLKSYPYFSHLKALPREQINSLGTFLSASKFYFIHDWHIHIRNNHVTTW